MHDELAALQVRPGELPPFAVTLFDIDADPALRAAYDHKVPVLTLGDYEICHYFLDVGALTECLAQ